MIEVERVNGIKIFINPDLVKMVEVTPDTVVTFTDGEKMILRTSAEDIVRRIIEYRKKFSLPQIQSTQKT